VPLRASWTSSTSIWRIEQTRSAIACGETAALDRDASDALVPTLICQPAVENASATASRRPGRGTTRLEARRDGDSLRLDVRDDGRNRSGAMARRASALSNNPARPADQL